MTLRMESKTFYATHSEHSEPGPYAELLRRLPEDVGALCEVIQGLLIHVFHAAKYGVDLEPERMQEMHLYGMEEMLGRVLELEPAPLTAVRAPERRLVANCRDYALFLCAMLRAQGRAARLRTGFESYFHRKYSRFGDHTICEYWDDSRECWVCVDAQLDALQRQAFKIGFDPLNLPEEEYAVSGRVWLECRNGSRDPKKCGILHRWGLDYVRGNVVKDVMMLNKVELFPWDGSVLGDKPREALTEDDMALLDELAALTWPEVNPRAVREQYARNTDLHGIKMLLKHRGLDPAM